MSDYLWDKTGEADPEIERLEEMLGTLRFQGQAPELPLSFQLKARARRSAWPGMAVAAAIVLMVLSTGLWVAMRRGNTESLNPPEIANAGSGINQTAHKEIEQPSRSDNTQKEQDVVPTIATLASQPPRHYKPRRAVEQKRDAVPARDANSDQTFSRMAAAKNLQRLKDEQERAEGMRAKEELMRALQVASNKLNLAQKKTREY